LHTVSAGGHTVLAGVHTVSAGVHTVWLGCVMEGAHNPMTCEKLVRTTKSTPRLACSHTLRRRRSPRSRGRHPCGGVSWQVGQVACVRSLRPWASSTVRRGQKLGLLLGYGLGCLVGADLGVPFPSGWRRRTPTWLDALWNSVEACVEWARWDSVERGGTVWRPVLSERGGWLGSLARLPLPVAVVRTPGAGGSDVCKLQQWRWWW